MAKKQIRKKFSKSPVKQTVLKTERELEKKKKELLLAKEKHRKLAAEFIDLWVKVKRAKRGIV